MADESLDEYGPVPENTLRSHYLKSAFFRVIHVDGALGGITARGYISASLYSERRAIPRVTEQKLKGEQTEGPEYTMKSRRHVIREVESGILLVYKTAVEFRDWLSRRIEEHEKAFGKSDELSKS